MYTGSRIGVKVDCKDSKEMLIVDFVLRYSPCSQEFIGVESNKKMQTFYLVQPQVRLSNELPYTRIEYIRNSTTIDCSSGANHYLPSFLDEKPIIIDSEKENVNAAKNESSKKPTTLANEKEKAKSKSKRALSKDAVKAVTSPTTTKGGIDHQDMLQVWQDGYYVFILRIVDSKNKSNVDVAVEMRSKSGYLSAVDFPLIIFYGVMGIVYIIFGLVWLVLLACSWKDLLRVQFWIGGVIVLGMLEKAVFYAEYQSVQATGQSVRGAIVFAELVSCLKRALARMLVIIVSLGFGIVKPRLGPAFPKVLAVGFIYFVLASIEGCMRGLAAKGEQSREEMFAAVPLAITDASICCLIQTTRTLRLRRNVVKLSLYRHFTNTLIFAVLASVVYMLWSITQLKMKSCITDWKELWVDDAFWHLLFSLLLCVIMILWRPSANNQRYAFSPLLDAADEEDEAMMNDAFDGMKMRGVKGATNGTPKGRSSVEDDLKWVEENIPTSVTDKALPSLLDSDEEMMTTRYEVNKMQ
ncbi:hypothetical protein FSP39_018542 [Pinctada imbricata]|uniref:GOST seven transmembrane domain-containing protein n=1 Tax=Pinctada imbricata TaxID=66713 RepID=A0AA89C3T1_PINIB|nr:hypothetical protein FSP39_018542 [Pinctada imbricata]